ncbi:MAG TPA: Yip1 family protein [Bacteroidota bacterium]
MTTCPVCRTENDEFATVCRNCKSFIQNRIPNLDFFATVWKVIESPRQAFHDITLAEHKNYSLLLFSLFGIGLSFTAFWYFKLGSRFDSLLDLLAKAVFSGVALGLVCAMLFTVLFHLTARVLGGRGSFRTSLGVLAYATTPVFLSLVLILPIELLTFGMFLFTSNPDPYTIKPGLYVALISVDVAVSLWAFGLAVIGGSVSRQFSVGRSLVSLVLTTVASLMILFVIVERLIHFL